MEKKYGPVDIAIQFVSGYHEPCNFPFDGRDGDIAHAYYPYQGQGKLVKFAVNSSANYPLYSSMVLIAFVIELRTAQI